MAKHSDLITDAELGELAAKISSQVLEQIAIRWLDIDMDTVDNERKTCRENQWKFNFNLLRKWNNKNKDHGARQVNIIYFIIYYTVSCTSSEQKSGKRNFENKPKTLESKFVRVVS